MSLPETTGSGGDGHIQVALRVRPLLPAECERLEKEAIAVTLRGDPQSLGMELWRHAKGGDGSDTEVRVFVASSQEKRDIHRRKAPTTGIRVGGISRFACFSRAC